MRALKHSFTKARQPKTNPNERNKPTNEEDNLAQITYNLVPQEINFPRNAQKDDVFQMCVCLHTLSIYKIETKKKRKKPKQQTKRKKMTQ